MQGKHNINMKKLILINGPSCAGKSTVVSSFFEAKKDIFWLKYDAVKRFFVDYEPATDKQKVVDLLTVIAKDRITKNETILAEGLIDESFYDIQQFAKDSGYTIYEFNIEAPYDVLLARFRERVKNPIPGIKINSSEDKHLEIYTRYQSTKNQNAVTLNTNVMTPEDISHTILETIQ